MPEINQPTPIKPVWPMRRDDRPPRSRSQEMPDEKGDSKADDGHEQSDRKEDDGHRIDEYA